MPLTDSEILPVAFEDRNYLTNYIREDHDYYNVLRIPAESIYASITATQNISIYTDSNITLDDTVQYRYAATPNMVGFAHAEEFPEESVNRARALLESAMDEEQRKEAAEKSLFHVRSSKGKLFRLRTTHASGNVEEIDEKGDPVARYCAHPKGVPLGDQLLAQKLALETDEDAFLKVANCHWRRDPRVMPELREALRNIVINAQPIYALDVA